MPSASWAETENNTLNEVKVISTTPLEGIGLSTDKVPANVQVIKQKQLEEQGSLTIADFMNNNLQGVNVVETQGNPYQPDVYFHGFNASSLLGAPQGLSVYVDGVRVNEPFGDVVSWDLIPMNAIDQMQLIPGTNPVFGLNTLGGSISVKTKRGRNNQGGSLESTFGSWGRKVTEFEYGGISEKGLDYFFAVTNFNETGWRDASPSSVNQYFGQLGWQDNKTDFNLTMTVADNTMTGNGLVSAHMMETLGRAAINTKPDETKNQMIFLNLTAQRELSNDSLLSGNAYYRHVTSKTLNGDLNDGAYEQKVDNQTYIQNFATACRAGGVANVRAQNLIDPQYLLDPTVATNVDDNATQLTTWGIDSGKTKSSPTRKIGATTLDQLCNAALNTSETQKNGLGGTVQWTSNAQLSGKDNQFTSGVSYNFSKIQFNQDKQYGYLANDRSVVAVPYFSDESTDLTGTTNSMSLFASNTYSYTDKIHLTASARYDYTAVSNVDNLIPAGQDGTLTADHHFQRLNPAIGLNYSLTNSTTVFAAYNEGSRAPTSMELGCADPEAPCKLPNSMAGDPALKQVVTKSFDIGLRGTLGQGIGWSIAAYQATNFDDIQFMREGTGTGSAKGYFSNIGKTKRVGLDASIFGSLNSFSWSANISSIKATYEDSFQSYVGHAPNKGNARSRVAPGDKIPGIPELQLKLRTAYQVTPSWRVGSNVVYMGSTFLSGNENNDFVESLSGSSKYYGTGKSDAYTVVHLDTSYSFEGTGWQVIGKLNNVFDTKFNTGGWQGASMFNKTTNAYAGDDYRVSFFAPGSPRAIWVGVKYEFDKPKNKN
ncbi:MAG: TonB-dependent receptor [Micrococcales bacterium]|nr:TonB-dependent receptor [Micrococcales bacterium]